jgi:hypothetical protein
MRALHAALAGVLGIVAVASPGCTAVYSDFEECSVEPPRVFETPPCGEDYVACFNGCGADAACRDRCATERPECDQCFTDTYRICANETLGCEPLYTDLVCCVEGLCPITNPSCEACADLSAEVSECWEAAGPTCQPRLNECVVGF